LEKASAVAIKNPESKATRYHILFPD